MEQYFRIDPHTSAGAAGTAKSAHTALCEHLIRVDQVLAAVVPRSLLGITQRLIRLSDIFEPIGRFRVIRVFVWVMHDGQFSVGFLDLVLAGILVYTEDLVVVLSLAFFELELCVADVFGNAWFLCVGLLDCFQVANGGFPVTGFTESGSFCFASFEVGGVQGEGTIAVINGGFVVF